MVAWAKEINGIAQAGLTYSQNEYDLERYAHLMAVAADIMAAGGGIGADERLAHWALQDGYATPKVDIRAIVFNVQGQNPACAGEGRWWLGTARRLGRSQ